MRPNSATGEYQANPTLCDTYYRYEISGVSYVAYVCCESSNIRDIIRVNGVPCTLPGGKRITAIFAGITDFERMLILDRALWIEPPRQPEASALDRQMRSMGLIGVSQSLGRKPCPTPYRLRSSFFTR